jgi:hypothetical protein
VIRRVGVTVLTIDDFGFAAVFDFDTLLLVDVEFESIETGIAGSRLLFRIDTDCGIVAVVNKVQLKC